MSVAQEAGIKTLAEASDMDGLEYLARLEFVRSGPSTVRTQLLLAQIVQLLCATGGGRVPKIEDLLPYYPILSTDNSLRAKEAKRQAIQAQRRSMVNALLDREVGSDGDG